MQNIVDIYARQTKQYPVLDRVREREVAEIYANPATSAVERRKAGDLLVCSNLRFAMKQAHFYHRLYKHPFEDLVQVANEGLIAALRLFEPQRGYRFISFAVHWIKAKLTMYCLYNHSLVKFGTNAAQRTLFGKARFMYGQLRAQHPELGDREIFALMGETTGIDPEVVEDVYTRMTAGDVSLNKKIDHEELNRVEYQDLLEADLPSPETRFIDAEQKQRLLEAAMSVARNAREEFIVKHRLLADEPMTLDAISFNFKNAHGKKVSRERIRQVETALLQRIRAVL